MAMVVNPRCGHPTTCSIEMNSKSCVMPVMISGMTRGAFTMPVNRSRPRNILNLTRAIAAKVPRTTAPVDTTTPIWSDSHAASST